MKKSLKITGIVILIVTFALILLFILWEVLGIICNDIAGYNQTDKVIKLSESHFGEVCSYDTFVGNTGNGNHVDLITSCIVSSDKSVDEITDEFLKDDIDAYVISLAEYINSGDNELLENLDIPKDWESGSYYYIQVYDSAPFSDNIMGH